ncbi:protein-glutamate O-methyltransferase CheR [Lentzea sp. HUAS12]|uniref:CheR family methyltransferase n=1 Tax=Lentzea sp. HUAS12 TaxID=2951806 RepID=UPI0035319703
MDDRLPTPGPGFEDVLLHLEEARGSDFTGYERAGLIRLVQHRMSELGIGDHAGYVEHLRADAGEVSALVDAVPADVPGFFRDPEAWTSLREQGVPAILAERGPHDPIRVWSAGCASGEEAYSLAIAFAEVVGIEQFRQRVKIYATDVDDEALAKARLASYGERELRGVPPELIARYFERQDGHHRFRKDLRRSIVFGRNDLEQDAPISRLDLLVCRNTLTYLDQRTRAEVLGRFHFALAPGACCSWAGPRRCRRTVRSSTRSTTNGASSARRPPVRRPPAPRPPRWCTIEGWTSAVSTHWRSRRSPRARSPRWW